METGNRANIDSDIETDGPLFKNRKRQKLSPSTRPQNENKYQMADGIPSLESTQTHKYVTTCESFIEEVANGFITNSIQNVLTESELDQCSSKNTPDDSKCENIELYTHFEPQEGRPILNTSMIRFTNQIQPKGRSPLTAVGNQNSVPHTSQKKHLPTISSDESFYYYQRKVPQVTSGVDHFARLSYEVILSVFQWLPKKALLRCALVSKRFNEAASDESLWGRLDLAGRNLNVGAVGRVLRRGCVVVRLAQTKIASPIFVEDDIKIVSFPKLQYLDLSMTTISQQSLVELFAKCVNLKKLSLEAVPINAAVCAGIGKNRQLEALNMTMCTGLDKYGIKNLLLELKSLENLNISWTSMNTECVDTLIKRAPKSLIRLNIAGCRKSLADNHIAELAKSCPGLIELDVSDCVNLTSVCIEYLRKFKRLEFLSMSRCYNINPASYISLNETLPLLFLDIFGVLSDEAITLIQNKFPTVGINKFIHSAVARPTVGTRRTSIWGLRTRDG
ncbi:hypothetical protein HA402_012436 [Bradysia odoriphaga]|nr:hypothetical protein HA402_012436 [Bradysia odoriphaga]